jgi:vacuolar-type H+-ATPase subunit H
MEPDALQGRGLPAGTAQGRSMETGQSGGKSLSVREAMNRVLAAEKNAREQTEASRSEANRILGDARNREQLIRENTQRRIQRVHQSVQQATAARIRAMRREAADKMAVIDYEPGDAVARAAATLAQRLTSRGREHE